MTKLRALALAVVAVIALVGVRAMRGPSDKELLGLWIAGSPQKLDDELRFYYFHTGGQGLYRYGKVGFNQTRSFDWSVSGNELSLVFRKVGDKAVTRIVVEARDGHRDLVLATDPKNDGAQRYRFRPASLDDADLEGPLSLDATSEQSSGLERMWIDHQKFATGGQGFSMYQLSKHGSGGTALGWFHVGDFDDWSTEMLGYRVEPSKLTLRFFLRHEQASTAMRIDAGTPRTMTLTTDPRDLGAKHRYADAGPSF